MYRWIKLHVPLCPLDRRIQPALDFPSHPIDCHLWWSFIRVSNTATIDTRTVPRGRLLSDFSYVCLNEFKRLLFSCCYEETRRPRSSARSRRLRRRSTTKTKTTKTTKTTTKTTTTTTTTTTTMVKPSLIATRARTHGNRMYVYTRHTALSLSRTLVCRPSTLSSPRNTRLSYTLRGWITSSFFELTPLCFSLFATHPPSAPSIQPYEEEKQDFPARSSK